MTLWSEDVHYITDPIILLFWWLSLSGIREGFIFPKLSVVCDGTFNNTQPVTYLEIARLYSNVCTSFFYGNDNYKPDCWTFHGLRRTEFLHGVVGGAEDQQLQQDSFITFGSTFTLYMREIRAELDLMKLEQPYQFKYISTYKGKQKPYHQYKKIPEEKRFDQNVLIEYVDKFISLYHGASDAKGIMKMGSYFKNLTQIGDDANKKLPELNEKIENFIKLYREKGLSMSKQNLIEAQSSFLDYSRILDVVIAVPTKNHKVMQEDKSSESVCPEANANVENNGSKLQYIDFSPANWECSLKEFKLKLNNESLLLKERMDAVIKLSTAYACIHHYIVCDVSLPPGSVMKKTICIFIQQKLKYLYNCITNCHDNNPEKFLETLSKKSITFRIGEWHNKCPCK